MNDLIFSIGDVFNRNDPTGCLQQYSCTAFLIPAYQRGYKWGSDKNEPVDRLMADLMEVFKAGRKEYFLQAATVKKTEIADEKKVLEVIDGQQRLTTLSILISIATALLHSEEATNIAKGKIIYSIRHEHDALDDLLCPSNLWIKALLKSAAKNSYNNLVGEHKLHDEVEQDLYYLKCASLRIWKELKDNTEGTDFNLKAFFNFVLDDVKLILNSVEAHVEAEKVFGNLNSNRVQLNETELIKGLLLTRVARHVHGQQERNYREVLEIRINLGRKWDEITTWATRPEIKTLFFAKDQSGMHGLLKLVADQLSSTNRGTKSAINESSRFPLFEFFLAHHDLAKVFQKLNQTHARIDDWFEEPKTYNLLGFCLSQKKHTDRSAFLLKCLETQTRSELFQILFKSRNKSLSSESDDKGSAETLFYGDDNPRITATLLALSVFPEESTTRFDFFAFETNKWTLEHIFPQTPLGKDASLNETQIRSIREMLTSTDDILTKDDITELNAIWPENITPEKLQTKRPEIDELLSKVKNLHRIGNLCLLSSSDNSSIGCGMFNDKRGAIRRRIMRGSFVPRHTYEVFSKMIVGEDSEIDVWSLDDIKAHEEKVSHRIQDLLEVTQ